MTIFWENWKCENVTTRYNVYPIANQLNRVKRQEKLHRLKSQPMLSDHEAFQTECCEPFDFPTRISAGFPCTPGILKSLKINQNQFLNFSIKTRPCITESGHFKILED